MCLEHTRDITVSFDKTENVRITFDFQLDPLSTAILEIQRHYLLSPFCLFIEKQNLGTMIDKNHLRQLDFAIFTYSILSKDFNDKWEIFFANSTVEVMLLQIETLQELDHLGNNTTKKK